jgi:hypothetical protein
MQKWGYSVNTDDGCVVINVIPNYGTGDAYVGDLVTLIPFNPYDDEQAGASCNCR